MKIMWLKRAINQQQEAIDYIAQQNPYSALNILDRVIKATELLENYTQMGRNGRVKGTRELVIDKTPFILVYRIQNDRIEILNFLHYAQQWPPLE
ncbi:type II toxin-antitoxin system RelE/ParE family toxin [Commensalibacter nepenthis]|uniref:Type II toxin-antitoxin system RelE/ParE family toxin n=1 Tax=Commensalibacter nepenthis TaxID=3043872 RepID=A0ABT6Q4A1_9PROT|nr:type II toxin-antitoxin system RelE/ParE family toxin [Commensalibacter sp. TBRC 10068]MDI2111722.1 type II toxin-antitoxin system RelE/ParE family toxin [Commensalibacter sp. TBRC 10068]